MSRIGKLGGAALGLTAVLCAFELVLWSWGLDTVPPLSTLARSLLRDLSLIAPAAVLAVVWGLALAKRTSFGVGPAGEGAPDFLRAALVALVFGGVLFLSVLLRDASLVWSSGGAAVTDRFLCTAVTTLRAADPGFGFLETARGSAELALTMQPAALLGAFLVVRRGRQPTAARALRVKRGGSLASLLLAVAVLSRADAQSGGGGGTGGKVPGVNRAPLPDACPAGMPKRAFEVSAIHVKMTLNRFGDHDAAAFMYALDSAIPSIRAQEKRAPPDRVSVGLRDDPIQPLVLRANLGDCVVIRFTNALTDGATSLTIDGLPRSISNGGGAVGLNPDTFANPGETVIYTYVLPTEVEAERAYHFHDHGAQRQRLAHGLFGALVVEPLGATYLDPQTGGPLVRNSWEAMIAVPGQPAFREFVLAYHEVGDEKFEGILDAKGEPLPTVDDVAGTYRPGARAINYRSEPFRDRLLLHPDKSQGYGSYMFGDPATPLPFSYLGEPTRTRLIHAGGELFHVHHLHGGSVRWRRNPETDREVFGLGLTKVPLDQTNSIALDSQSIGPGNAFNLAHECSAGGCQQAAGDFLFHCHIQHHYLSGMWGFWRVFDTLQPELAVLPGRPAPPTAVPSTGLLGLSLNGKTFVPDAALSDPTTEASLEKWIEAQLPPSGARLHAEDATVWDWKKVDSEEGPLYLGEPESVAVWANFKSETPGQRHPILFNPTNGRYAWPLLRPHLGKRPPFSGNGHTGAPWLGEEGSAMRPDGLCPDGTIRPGTGRQRRSYPITAIAKPIPFAAGAIDPDGMIYVLNEDKGALYADERPAEPLVIRSNSGDCVDVVFTSELPDRELNGFHSKANIHTHFVQFDPQASDGVISGFSFEQSVRPYHTEDRTLTKDAKAGDSVLEVTNVKALRPGVWIGVGLGEGMCQAQGGGPARACTEVRKIASLEGASITLTEPLELDHGSGQHVGVEFVRYAWYSDVESGTVFWHDHVQLGGWTHGLFGAHIVEPAGSTWHDPVSGAEVRSGAMVDVHTAPEVSLGAGQVGSFREIFLAITDRGGGGEAVPGVVDGAFNLRSEPFANREAAAPGALRFSSVRHGDPATPLGRAYLGDPVMIRGLGVTEMVGGIRVTGHRFRLERFAENAQRFDSAAFGVSERFDLLLENGAGGVAQKPGDYLYYSTIGRELVGGAWGLLRVHDTLQGDLQPLPGRPPPPPGEGFPKLTFTGKAPPAAEGPGQPCPSTAPVRAYNVRISRADVRYNPDLKDSGGIVYTIKDASAPPKSVREPLVVRANKGDCLELSLTNLLDEPASLNVGELPFDPQGSYGAAIGLNPDSAVPPGATRRYRYFADAELGTAVMLNLADPQSGARGAFGAVIVEPEGARYRNPKTGGPAATGIVADIFAPGRRFREYVTLFSDEDPRIGSSTMPYKKDVKRFTGLSYHADPFELREATARPRDVFNSRVHGDPGLVFHAHLGDPAIFRVAQPWGEQPHVFGLEGHRWHLEHTFPANSEQMAAAQVIPGDAFDCDIYDFDGEGAGSPGDYLFGDRRQPFQEAGLWGLLRVHPKESLALKPLETPAASTTTKKVIVKSRAKSK